MYVLINSINLELAAIDEKSKKDMKTIFVPCTNYKIEKSCIFNIQTDLTELMKAVNIGSNLHELKVS